MKSARKFNIDPKKLDTPFATIDAERPSKIIPLSGSSVLNVPRGFKVAIFAEGNLRCPRMMALAPNGDIFVTDSYANSVVILRDSKNVGVADRRFLFSNRLSQPFGIAFNKGYLYVANTDSLARFSYRDGQTSAGGNPERLTELTPGKPVKRKCSRILGFKFPWEKTEGIWRDMNFNWNELRFQNDGCLQK